MGRKFFEGDIPRMLKSLEGIHEELRRANDLKEQELKGEAVDENVDKHLALTKPFDKNGSIVENKESSCSDIDEELNKLAYSVGLDPHKNEEDV